MYVNSLVGLKCCEQHKGYRVIHVTPTKMISIVNEITCSKKPCITIRAFINVEITNYCKCFSSRTLAYEDSESLTNRGFDRGTVQRVCSSRT
ncbi:hypothetical protein HanPI659440_Chr15g0594071 [Helianthus annuus]|nr:hypothetical protein HanPI659440_Chr15g0594071 [Helianthus annuus]